MFTLLQNYFESWPDYWPIVFVIVAILVVIVVRFSLKKLLKYLIRYTDKTESQWDGDLIKVLSRPTNVLIWLLILTYAAEFIWFIADQKFPNTIISVRRLGLIICAFWFILRFLQFSEKHIVAKRISTPNFDETGVRFVYKLLRVSVIAIAALTIVSNLGYSISGILAFGGLGGIAVGFAAKDLLANFFGGLMIYLDRPFKEGDWIRSPDREIEGTVESIGWRLTRIKTFERRPIYVPNAIFAQVVVENPSRMESRRFKEIIGVRYDDIGKVAAIVEDIKTLLKQHPKIDDSRLLIVGLDAFDASSVNIIAYSYIKETRGAFFYKIKQEILLAISDIVQKHNAEIAFPTRTIHINKTTSE